MRSALRVSPVFQFSNTHTHTLEIEPRVGPHKVGDEMSHVWGGTLSILEVLRGYFWLWIRVSSQGVPPFHPPGVTPFLRGWASFAHLLKK